MVSQQMSLQMRRTKEPEETPEQRIVQA